MANKPMTSVVEKQIKEYIKARLDISDLIEGYNIKGMNLERAIITRFNRKDEDLSGTNVSKAILGKEGEISNCSRTNFSKCSFQNARLLGTFWFRKSNLTKINFKGCHMPHLQYQFADFRGSDFCGGCFPIGTMATKAGVGAKFSDNIFLEIASGWDLNILTPAQVTELLQKPEFKPTIDRMLKENHEASKRV